MTAIHSVLVVVVNHNTPALTAQAVASSLEPGPAHGPAHVRVVVANVACSADGAYRDTDPRVKIVETALNIGFGAANNMAVAADDRAWDAAMLLNSDARLEPGCLGTLCAALGDDPAAGAVGPRITYPDGRLQDVCARRVPDLRTELRSLLERYGRLRGVAQRALFYPTAYYEERHHPEALSGACVLVRREFWRQLGGFDERYFMYWEDVQLCVDGAALGWRYLYEPRATCTHALGQSAASSLLLAQRRSALLFMSTNPWRAVGERCLLVLEAGAMLVRSLVRKEPPRNAGELLRYAVGPLWVRPFALHLAASRGRPPHVRELDLCERADDARRRLGVATCVVLSHESADAGERARFHGHVVATLPDCGHGSGLRSARLILHLILRFRPGWVVVDSNAEPPAKLPYLVLRWWQWLCTPAGLRVRRPKATPNRVGPSA